MTYKMLSMLKEKSPFQKNLAKVSLLLQFSIGKLLTKNKYGSRVRVAQMAMRSLGDQKVMGSNLAGSNETIFLRMHCNDVYSHSKK